MKSRYLLSQGEARQWASPELNLRSLFQLSRRFRDPEKSPTDRIEELMPQLKDFELAPISQWNLEALAHARHFAEEIIVLYVSYFHDLSQIPVTFYKREKWIRRRLDFVFSSIFREIGARSGQLLEKSLITEEPIYYLLQKAREKSFPHGPRSQGRAPHLPTLKMRFHVDLARHVDSEDSNDSHESDRRVLLPYEIKSSAGKRI